MEHHDHKEEDAKRAIDAYIIYMRLHSKYIITIILTILTGGCSLTPNSVGEPGGLVVVADELDRPIVRAQIERTFGQIILTPQPEPLFHIDWCDAQQLSHKSRSPILLFTTTLEGEGSTAKFVNKMLSDDIRKGIEDGEYFVFKRRDAWALGQLILILVGRTRSELGALASEWMDTLKTWAFEFELNRTEKNMFKHGEQKKLERHIEAQYGFTFRMQHDYLLAEENDSLKFIRILRHWPERWLTIMWGDTTLTDTLEARFFFEQRNKRGFHFLNPVSLYKDHWNSQSITFKGKKAILINGLWETLDVTGGGPFFSYCFYDKELKRYFIIDGAVFAPGEAKMPYLWQLYTLAHTFKLKEI